MSILMLGFALFLPFVVTNSGKVFHKEDLRHVSKATGATAVFIETKSNLAVSSLLRGANDYMLDEMERALHDALCIVKRTLESNAVVAGGSAVESALSVYLEYLATTIGSWEQLDATELVAKLRADHHTAQTMADKQPLSSMGLDLTTGTTRNNLEAGIIEPAMSKVKIIQFATEAAIKILQIDDMSQAKLPKNPGSIQWTTVLSFADAAATLENQNI
ncbi:hypothetical protein C5167_043030 [Papaver somniferum]|uniref:Uncharacterized protein n=1 Tax=Papaver somniferum TaxID=3469 RepID=A0A4Y7L8D3_PAPSO|nr:hypothetical protein C5167_043030 [Papaver somniferum]